MKVEGEVVITSYNILVIIRCYKQWDRVTLSNVKTGKKLMEDVEWQRRK
jgi:hypothetical protein